MAHARNPYLSEHNIPEILDDIVGKLLVLKPHHPLLFLISECAEAEQERRRAATASGEGLGNYPNLEGRHNVMAQVLTKDLYSDMHNLRTAHGGVLDDIIQLGVDVPEHKFAFSAGCVATDAQCYQLFAPLLKSVVRRQYPSWEEGYVHETSLHADLGLATSFYMPNTHHALGYLCTLDRSVEGCAFPCLINRGDRRIVSSAVSNVLKESAQFPGQLMEGDEVVLRNRDVTVEQCTVEDTMELLRDYILNPPRLESAYDTRLNISRDWPDGRCVWHAEQRDLAAWTNIHEHIQLRYISTDVNSPVSTGTERLLSLGMLLQGKLAAMGCPLDVNADMGALLSSPSNVGTGFTLSVVLLLDRLARHKRFDQLLDSLQIHCFTVADVVNGSYFGLPVSTEIGPLEHPPLSASTVFISKPQVPAIVCVQSRYKVGVTVKDVLSHTLHAVSRLSELEESLSRNQSIDDSIIKLNAAV